MSTMTKVAYECAVNAKGCKRVEMDTHPEKDPVCCGEPMKKRKDSCCEPECGPITCGQTKKHNSTSNRSGADFMDPDISLVLKAKSGDARAFEELIGRHQTHVLNTFYRLLGKRSQSEDLTQEVFLKLFKSLSRYQSKSKFSTYLFTIVANTFRDTLRKKKTYQTSVLPQYRDLLRQVKRQNRSLVVLGLISNIFLALPLEMIQFCSLSQPKSSGVMFLSKRYANIRSALTSLIASVSERFL